MKRMEKPIDYYSFNDQNYMDIYVAKPYLDYMFYSKIVVHLKMNSGKDKWKPFLLKI